ncbi:hypothetical protein Tco_0929881 [Tanacetum coccineum]
MSEVVVVYDGYRGGCGDDGVPRWWRLWWRGDGGDEMEMVVRWCSNDDDNGVEMTKMVVRMVLVWLRWIVVSRRKSAKEAWIIIFDIVKDNKRSRTNTLKAELRSIKLGDQSMEYYFQKINSIVNILTSLDDRVNEEDVVHYAL